MCFFLIFHKKNTQGTERKQHTHTSQNTRIHPKTLQAHRPAFADELDKLEGELRRYYEVYVDRFRNLDFLEHDLDRFHESELEELEEYERKRNRNAERIRKEQLKQVRL